MTAGLIPRVYRGIVVIYVIRFSMRRYEIAQSCSRYVCRRDEHTGWLQRENTTAQSILKSKPITHEEPCTLSLVSSKDRPDQETPPPAGAGTSRSKQTRHGTKPFTQPASR